MKKKLVAQFCLLHIDDNLQVIFLHKFLYKKKFLNQNYYTFMFILFIIHFAFVFQSVEITTDGVFSYCTTFHIFAPPCHNFTIWFWYVLEDIRTRFSSQRMENQIFSWYTQIIHYVVQIYIILFYEIFYYASGFTHMTIAHAY